MSSHAIIPFLILTTFFCRKLVLVNNSWRQPQLLRLPRNYDSIFQVSFDPLLQQSNVIN